MIISLLPQLSGIVKLPHIKLIKQQIRKQNNFLMTLSKLNIKLYVGKIELILNKIEDSRTYQIH
jgi:hypothetical protein